MYGDAEATKLTLLKMRRDADFNRWRVEDSSEAIANRLASAGIGPRPSVAYWKRSPTAAHNNGVFVGKIFDTYLGSAAVSCSLSGLLVGGVPPALSAAARERWELEQKQQEEQEALQQQQPPPLQAQGESGDGGNGGAGAAEAAPGSELAAEADRAVAAAAAKEVPLDLGEYSGLVIRAIGDGKSYTAVIRTRDYADGGLEYHCDFQSSTSHFESHRLPFSRFVAVRGARPVADAPELDRHTMTGLALAFYPQRNNPEDPEATGEFYLSVSNIKAYRKRDEPEFVYLSDAGVASLPRLDGAAHKTQTPTEEVVAAAAAATAAAAAAETATEAAAAAASAASAAAAAADAGGATEEAPEVDAAAAAARVRLQTKHKGEAMLRASGLTYFIARAPTLNDKPAGMRRLAISQGQAPAGVSVSRADIAEVAVKSLLDPRACNVACTVCESRAAAGEQDISQALELLEPNRM